MPVRVELTRDAEEDLARYAVSGSLDRFLAKLVRLEDVGKDAGLPLGRNLAGWRKIVVGDRDWRIIFKLDQGETVGTVRVIGDRADEECYREAERRVVAAQRSTPEMSSLAAALVKLMQGRRRRGRR